jgi:hypothetical protein
MYGDIRLNEQQKDRAGHGQKSSERATIGSVTGGISQTNAGIAAI